MIFRSFYILVILGLALANLSDKWDENVRPKVVVDYLQNKSKKTFRFLYIDSQEAVYMEWRWSFILGINVY